MALELIPPGKRKNNPFFLVRGTLGGRNIEVSTKTRDEAAAQRFKAKLEIKLVKDRLPGPGETVSFRRAAELYFASKALPVADERRIQLVVDYIDPRGEIPVANVQSADLLTAANALYTHVSDDTKNRWAIGPGAAILHYAAENNWRPWARITKL